MTATEQFSSWYVRSGISSNVSQIQRYFILVYQIVREKSTLTFLFSENEMSNVNTRFNRASASYLNGCQVLSKIRSVLRLSEI